MYSQLVWAVGLDKHPGDVERFFFFFLSSGCLCCCARHILSVSAHHNNLSLRITCAVTHVTSDLSIHAAVQVILSVLARNYDWSVDVNETFIQTSPLPAVTNGMPMKCWRRAAPLMPKAKATC